MPESIHGLGFDIVEVHRVRALINRWKDRFLDRVFTQEEIRTARGRQDAPVFFSGRFAAKEAVMKAIGRNDGDGIAWTDIEILPSPSGQPVVKCRNAAQRTLASNRIASLMVTISHTGEYAASNAIAVRRDSAADPETRSPSPPGAVSGKHGTGFLDPTQILKKRRPDSHKGDYGHVAVIAGSAGMTGAACLCARAALACGSGLVTLGIPRSLNIVAEIQLVEVMSKPLPETRQQTLSAAARKPILALLSAADAAAIGPGISRNRETAKLIHQLLPLIRKPFVLDADGLNALAGKPGLLKKACAPCVITPHPGEMSRLCGLSVPEIQKNRETVARDFSNKYNTVVVLKGHGTVVASPEGGIFVNRTGNPGMASGGTGDVLTGMIAGFLGQGIKAFDAARLGAQLHGAAGDIAAEKKGQMSMVASDIIACLPDVLKGIRLA